MDGSDKVIAILQDDVSGLDEDDDRASHHGGAGARPQDHPRRHGRVLRLGGAARRSRPPRQTPGGRRFPRARRRGRSELRGQNVRRALGDAVGDGAAQVPGPRLRQAALRGLQGHLSADPRHLRRAYPGHRTTLARRGLPRRHREPAGRSRSPPTSRRRSGRRSARRPASPPRRACPTTSSSPSSPPTSASPTGSL